jgi:outer membrane protein OmpA-like peptidoglycan-associated protein
MRYRYRTLIVLRPLASILSFFLLILPGPLHAQGILGRIRNKVNQAAGSATDKAVDKATDKMIDKAINSRSGSAKAGDTPVNQPGNSPAPAGLSSPGPGSRDTSLAVYSKYDFVAGDSLLFADDHAQDAVGEFPAKWNTNNRGETVSLSGISGKWLKLYQSGTFLTPNKQSLTENYTIEFDLVLDLHNKGALYPTLYFALTDPGKEDPAGNVVLSDYRKHMASIIELQPGGYHDSKVRMVNYSSGREVFKTPVQDISAIESYYGRPAHIAIQVQGQRFRMWLGEKKIFDLPRLLPEKMDTRQLAIQISSSNYKDDEAGIFLSNTRFATGLPDTRNKLLTTGKFETTGICFDVNADRIRPESYGALKQIATVLQENAEVNITIIGHTDADGKPADNLLLSKKRAEAVKTFLSTQFEIAPERMETDGKGASMPVGDNHTPAGKARNRRVEFRKR